MDTKVEIVSSEIIKPSSPTSDTLKIFKLSLLEQMGINSPYVSILLFYPNANADQSIRLKNSLSQALNHNCMYPLAGRIKDTFSIDCNDKGALFIKARVNKNISTVLKHPKLDFLQQLLPPDPIETTPNPCERVLLGVQVNRFSCRGIAIGVSVSHAIADAAALASFLTNWAALAREEKTVNHDCFIVDCTSIFPPRDFDFLTFRAKRKEERESKTKANRFIFNASKIASLREKFSETESRSQPTRLEALSAFIWGAIIESGKLKPLRAHIMCSIVNLRKKIIPQLPLHSLGNITHVTAAIWTAADDTVMAILVGKVRDSLRKVNDDEVKKVHGSDEFFNGFKTASEKSSNTNAGVGLLLTSSWCRFPFYDIDFGWGKPVWVSIGDVQSDTAILMDASDGEGIEAWVRLPEDDMAKLQQNHEFVSYVSSAQSL